MAVISNITLPNGNSYDLKDAAAQRTINDIGILKGLGNGNITSISVDTVPTENSGALVESGGVWEAIKYRERSYLQIFSPPTNTTPPTMTGGEKTITVTDDYDKYSYIALIFDTAIQNDYHKRAVVVVPTFMIRFSAHYPVIGPTQSGYIRLANIEDQPKQIKLISTDMTGLWLRGIYAFR